MAVDKTVKLQVDVSEALKRLDDLEKQIEGVDDTTKKTEGTARKLMKGFTGVGLAMKGGGVRGNTEVS
jgi:predicted ATP-grasp superfamily ATP-dependent carboligase